MKTCRTVKTLLPTAALLSVFMSSCDNSTFDITETESETSCLNVITRSATGSKDLQTQVFAFDMDGTCVARTDADSDYRLNLELGKQYHITAIATSGTCYSIPKDVSHESVIRMTGNEGWAISPLEMARTDVTTSKSTSTLSLQMQFAVTCLTVELTGIPEEYDTVMLSFPDMGTGLSMSGNIETGGTVSIGLEKRGEVWTCDPFHVFPGTKDKQEFNVRLIKGDTECITAVSTNQPFKAGTPYHITGTFADGDFLIEGHIGQASWNTPENMTFQFGPRISESGIVGTDEGGDSDTGDDNPVSVNRIPTPTSEWNGHIVALVYDADGNPVSDESEIAGMKQATLLLISLDDWDKMTSAGNESTPDMAAEAAHGYIEYGMDGWDIPTETQARQLKAAYNDDSNGTGSTSLSILNAAIVKAGGVGIETVDGSDNVRYLCERATRTFCFKSASLNVTNAGAKTANYHLRPVRTVSVKTDGAS